MGQSGKGLLMLLGGGLLTLTVVGAPLGAIVMIIGIVLMATDKQK